MISKAKKTNIIKNVQMHGNDTGSADVQVAILTSKINALSSHLKMHRKDNSSRRGLLKLVSKRQIHMKYLSRKSSERHGKMLAIVKNK